MAPRGVGSVAGVMVVVGADAVAVGGADFGVSVDVMNVIDFGVARAAVVGKSTNRRG